MNKALRDQVMNLPADDKYELVMDLWDSLSDNELPGPTETQIAEAERRLDEHLRNPKSAIPYEEVLARLQTRPK